MNILTNQRLPKRQRGVSLPVALILLVPLTLLGVTLATRNNLEEMMAGSQRDGQQALMNAESGLAMGHQALEKLIEGKLTVGASIPLTDPPTNLTFGDVPLKDCNTNCGLRGDVTVVVLNNDDGGGPTVDKDGHVIMRSTGTYQSGERVVEAIVELIFPEGNGGNLPPLTIFTEEYLQINSVVKIHGPDALVHSNAQINIQDEGVWVAGTIQQVGPAHPDSKTYQKDGEGPTEITTGVTRMQTPFVYPPIYKGLATHYMASDCWIYDGIPGGTSLVTGRATDHIRDEDGNPVNGADGWFDRGNEMWKCSGGSSGNEKWEVKGENLLSGFYYVEGNVIINGNPGESDNPIQLSIVAEGYLEVPGEPFITPYYTADGDYFESTQAEMYRAQIAADFAKGDIRIHEGVNPWDAVLETYEVILLAGGDVKINGNSGSNFSFNGIIAAHDHFQISGNPDMQGAVIAENAKYSDDDFFFDNIMSDKGNTELVMFNEINGNPEIWGGSDLGGAGNNSSELAEANLEGWREVIE